MRSPFFALIRKDLKGYLEQPIGYILIVVFVALLSWWFFRSAFLSQEASLRPLFSVDFDVERLSLPWLLVVFVPAATMRLLAEEQRDGTLEILLTQPIRGWIVLLAKFSTGLIFVGIAILATVGIPIALSTAGDIDLGAVIAQYVGSLLLAASFVSIGLFTSSLTRNQIVAFILGLIVIAVLMFVGMEQVAVRFPDWLSGLLETLSPVSHFSSIARGVIDLRDVLYFVALVSTFMSAAYLMIRAKSLSHRSPQYRNLQLGVAGLIVLSLLVGWFGSSIGGRLDLTEDKIFTLSPGTAQILSGLDDLLTVELFQSPDPPPGISVVARDVSDFLEDFAASSKGKVKLVSRVVDGDEEMERRAQLAGVFPRQFSIAGQTEFQSKIVYLGLSMTYADRRETIPFVAAVDGFEYSLASLSNKMIQRDRKMVAFLAGHGEKRKDVELQQLAAALEDQYEVAEIEATEDGLLDLSGIDVLIVPGPTRQVPENVRQALTSYLDRGGKAMILIDSVLIDTSRGLVARPNRNSFADFVSRYGVTVDDYLVFDLQSNETLRFDTQLGSLLLPYPYWARVNIVDRKVAGEGSVILPWASSLGIPPEAEDGPVEMDVGTVEFIPLIETTEFASIDFEPGNVSPDAPVFDEVTERNVVQSLMAVGVTGRARLSSGERGEQGSFRLVVVGNSAWLGDRLIARNASNGFLALNLVDWLAQEDTLASIRSKVVSSRQLVFSSANHQNAVQYANILGVPLGFVVIGLLLLIRRRSAGLRVYGRER